MSLTVYQRQVLLNQHKILEMLSKEIDDKEYHKMMQEVYQSGYEYEYFEHGPYKDELSEEDCKFVYEVINMYDDLYFYWKSNEEFKNNVSSHKVMFPGFDLNHPFEHKLYSFSKFLIEDLGKFHDTRELLESGEIRELNSHGSGPGAQGYRLMFSKFEKYNDDRMKREKNDFTVEEFEDIVNPY